MTNRGHALSRDAIIRTLTAYSGITTADGAAGGTTLVDSNLIDNAFISPAGIPEKTVLILSGNARGEDKGSASFDNVTGEITLQGAGFGAQILAGTIYRILNISSTEIDVARIEAKVDLIDVIVDTIEALIGTAADNADLTTLFAKHKKAYLGTHTHVLLVVHDVTAIDADLDTALQQWLLDIGCIVTIADPLDVNGNLEVSAFDFVIVSASCVAGDSANLGALNEVSAPVICHSADIAASVVFSMGATPHTEATQTQIEITDNTPMWLIALALGDLTVTASANIFALNTITAASTELAQEATATGNHITISRLLAGDQNEVGYAAFYDRYFVGVGDYTNMNDVWKAVMEELVMHCVMEKRFTEEAVVKAKGIFVENIPSPDFALVAIDNVLTNPPPTPDAANTIVEIDERPNRTHVLRSLWVDVTDFGTAGTKLTFSLWTILGGAPVEVDIVDVAVLGIQNLMDLFGLPEIFSDAIYITVITDSAGADAACSGTYNYAEAKK